MLLTVRSVGPVRQILGTPELEVTVPEGTTVTGLIAHLEKEKGEGFSPYATGPESSTAHAPLRVLVNGRDVPRGKYSETVLDEADDVLIFAPIAGG